jgi:hypothetical protein
MPPDDDIRNDNSTYNTLRNSDKELLLRNGYRPGELPPEEERELLSDLRSEQAMTDNDPDANAIGEIGDEQDGTDADAS